MSGQRYNFSVSSQNCVKVGEDSNVVSAILPGEGIILICYYYYNYHLVTPPLDVNVYLNYNNDITKLVLSWTVTVH